MGRAVVGTAVVAGTAGAVRHHQQKRWARQDAEEQQATQEEAYEEPVEDEQAAPPPEQAPEEDDMVAQLEHLGQLHDQGVLTDEEFAAAKQKLLES